jgi:NADPH:quinone reductase-like Zn-dependent oxidoreductase
MKAAFIEQFGGREVLRYGNLPDPVAAPGEVVIDVVAGQRCRLEGARRSVQAIEVSIRPRSRFFRPDQRLGVMDLKLGDAVFGVCEAGQEGAYAEKIAVKAAAALMLSADEYQSPATATGVTSVVVSSSTVESS